jgi:hypothetical protein
MMSFHTREDNAIASFKEFKPVNFFSQAIHSGEINDKSDSLLICQTFFLFFWDAGGHLISKRDD